MPSKEYEDMQMLRTRRGDFEAIVEGPDDAPTVILLHGFPELNISWRSQIPALTAAGYRVLAPNQRGYGKSDRDGSYVVTDLAADVVSMADAIGARTFTVVGHDWGGGVAWTTAHMHQDRVDRLVAMNCPPPIVLSRHLVRDPLQIRKSWYMFFFQLPVLPERFVAGRVAGALVGGSYNRSAWNRETLEPYQRAFATPADATGPVNWYRAALRHPIRGREVGKHPITAPTLIIWGAQDRFLRKEMVTPQALSRAMAQGNEAEVVFLEDAGHFVQNEAPEDVNSVLLDWLRRTPVGG